MGTINKNSNIYDKDGNLVRKAPLKNYSIEELEDLVDKLANDKDEDGNVKDRNGLNNAMAALFKMYMIYGNPHKDELISKLQGNSATKTELTIEKLEELAEELEPQETIMDEYVEFEEAA